MKTLTSSVDESVNFIIPYGEGMMEARYVRRQPDYFICYLSSQSGCNRGCKFCHLTTTKQTSFDQVDRIGFIEQAQEVLKHYKTKAPAKVINYNWMSRGEALCNPSILVDWDKVSFDLTSEAWKVAPNLDIRFNMSTIMPKTLPYSLSKMFGGYSAYPTVYYSLYSVDQEWRDKWMPGAMSPDLALDELVRYQQLTQKIIYIHGAFIKDENDSFRNLYDMLGLIKNKGLIVKWNIVRYNPYSPVEGEESDKVQNLYDALVDSLGARNVQIVSRVGPDVHASCGTFFNGELYE